MTGIIRSEYDLNRGIQDILPFESFHLPDKAALAPSDALRASMLNTLYAARNCEASIAAFLRPSVRNLENLTPERRRTLLRRCRDALKDTQDPALIALGKLLQEDAERIALLDAFQNLLLAS